MLREQNIKNLKTEKEGIIILKSLLDTFIVPTKDQRKTLYNILNIDYKKYSRSVDGVVMHVDSFDNITTKNDFDLVEIKTTSSKSVKKLPYGVFFGFTKNEDLGRFFEVYFKWKNFQLAKAAAVADGGAAAAVA